MRETTAHLRMIVVSSLLMWNFPSVKGQKSLRERQFNDAVQRECHANHLTVFVNKSALINFTIVSSRQITLSVDEDYCSAQDHNSTHFIISLYGECGFRKRSLPGSTIWQNQVKLWSVDKKLLAAKDIQCVIPSASAGQPESIRLPILKNRPDQLQIPTTTHDPDANVTFNLQVFNTHFTGDPWIKYPQVADLNRKLYLQTSIRFRHPENEDTDLRALPLDCFFSKNSNSRDSSYRYDLLKHGCPYDNTVILHQNADLTRVSRLSFQVSRFYYDPTSHLFLHCRIGACSNRGDRDSEGFPKCPLSTACSDRRSTAVISDESEFRHLKYVSTGPIRVVVDRTTVNREAATTCPPCSTLTETSTLASARLQPRPNVIEGLNIPSVIGISIAAFLVGLALMGGLWYIHVNTSPKNFKLGSQTSSHDSGSTDSTSLHQLAPLLISAKLPPPATTIMTPSEKLLKFRLSQDTEVV